MCGTLFCRIKLQEVGCTSSPDLPSHPHPQPTALLPLLISLHTPTHSPPALSCSLRSLSLTIGSPSLLHSAGSQVLEEGSHPQPSKQSNRKERTESKRFIYTHAEGEEPDLILHFCKQTHTKSMYTYKVGNSRAVRWECQSCNKDSSLA